MMIDTNKISSLICFDGMIDAAMQLFVLFVIPLSNSDWLLLLFPPHESAHNSLCAITPRLANEVNRRVKQGAP